MNTMFLAVGIIGILAVVSPGPDFLMVTRNSLMYSRRVGLLTAFGIVSGNIFWIGLSVLGVAYVVSETVLLFNALKLLGAAYLMWLGIRSLMSKRMPEVQEIGRRSSVGMTDWQAFRMGLWTNILNPKCAVFFVSLFSVIITPKTPLVTQCAYGIEIMLIAITWFSFVAIVLSIPRVRDGFRRFGVWLDRLTGAILIALATRIALSSRR